MEFNFDELVDRSNTDCIKWGMTDDPDMLPMWIADMDFQTAPAIIKALQERVAHGVFGYTLTPPRFYEAITGWWHKRHGLALPADWILPVIGVIPALSAIIRALTGKADKIILQPPTYNHFFIAAASCGRQVVENNLHEHHGQYTIDFDDLEKKATDPAVKLLVLCNPHNPVGRAWTTEELRQILDICTRHQVVILSDEIHSDLVYEPYMHVPFASLGPEAALQSVTVSSPSKTFNLAGLQVGYLFSANDDFRKRIRKVFDSQDTVLLSPFAIEALVAAYTQGEAWLQALKAYLMENFAYVTEFCAKHLPQVVVTPLQATYLVWLDCRAATGAVAGFTENLKREKHLWLNPGTMYGASGEGFIRLNIACPRSLLHEGLSRLAQQIHSV